MDTHQGCLRRLRAAFFMQHQIDIARPITIVGQGLAGSVLALSLYLAGARQFQVFDVGAGATCSQAAAGLLNPLTGPKRVLTWAAAEAFPFAQQFYPWAEEWLGAHFFEAVPIFYPFANQEELNHWLLKLDTPGYSPWAELVDPRPAFPFGGFETKQSGTLHVPTFIATTRAWLQALGSLVEATYAHQAGDNQVIWATGYQPSFPLTPYRGQLLHLQATAWPKDLVLNRGVYAIPHPSQPEELFLGATYERGIAERTTTTEAREELLSGLTTWLPTLSVEVKEHLVGIRPGTRDRRPWVGGIGPDQFVFNGLGSKGCSLAPWLAHQWIHGHLPDEVLADRWQ